MYFENRMARLLQEAWHMEQGRTPPFIGIQHLIDMAEELEFSQNEG